jgi:hypothetical protein
LIIDFEELEVVCGFAGTTEPRRLRDLRRVGDSSAVDELG